jgi:hypothetical protein
MADEVVVMQRHKTRRRRGVDAKVGLIDCRGSGGGGRDRTVDLGVMNPTL